MINLLVNNESSGFKRTFFKSSLRSLGTRVLKDQEVPIPWTVASNAYVIKAKILPRFFSNNPDIKPEGCSGAREFYFGWRNSEREKKAKA